MHRRGTQDRRGGHPFDSAKHCPPQCSGFGRAAPEAIRDLSLVGSEVSRFIITERSANPRAKRGCRRSHTTCKHETGAQRERLRPPAPLCALTGTFPSSATSSWPEREPRLTVPLSRWLGQGRGAQWHGSLGAAPACPRGVFWSGRFSERRGHVW